MLPLDGNSDWHVVDEFEPILRLAPDRALPTVAAVLLLAPIASVAVTGQLPHSWPARILLLVTYLALNFQPLLDDWIKDQNKLKRQRLNFDELACRYAARYHAATEKDRHGRWTIRTARWSRRMDGTNSWWQLQAAHLHAKSSRLIWPNEVGDRVARPR